MQNAAYPIMLTSPNTQSSYGVVATAVAAAATAAIPKPAALCLRWSVWRSRPGHVVCVERLEVQTAPLLLEVEQAHAVQLMRLGNSLLVPFTDTTQVIRFASCPQSVQPTSSFMNASAISTQLQTHHLCRLCLMQGVSPCTHVSIVCMHRRRTPHEPDLLVLRSGGRQRAGGDKVYIEYLHITKLRLTLSFLPSPGTSWHPEPTLYAFQPYCNPTANLLQPYCIVSEGIHISVNRGKLVICLEPCSSTASVLLCS